MISARFRNKNTFKIIKYTIKDMNIFYFTVTLVETINMCQISDPFLKCKEYYARKYSSATV